MRTSVDDVHHWQREHLGIRASEILVERKLNSRSSRTRYRHGNAQNSICSQFFFVFGSIKSQHGTIDGRLVRRISSNQRWRNLVIDIGNSPQNSLAEVA